MNIALNLIDFIFPKTCIYCHQTGDYICQGCKFIFWEDYGNPIYISDQDYQVNICYRYNKAILEALELCKHKGYYQIANELGSLILEKINHLKFNKPVIFVPVPISRQKLSKRGFNQVKLIIGGILSRVDPDDYQSLTLINRNKDTKTQIGMNKAKRRLNLQDSFSLNTNACNSLDSLMGSEIVLVDDIYTTGATVDQCVRTLQNFGINVSQVVILAKA